MKKKTECVYHAVLQDTSRDRNGVPGDCYCVKCQQPMPMWWKKSAQAPNGWPVYDDGWYRDFSRQWQIDNVQQHA